MKKYNNIQVAIIATSNTPLNIIIYLENSNVFGATYRPHQDLYTNIYSIKTFVEQKHKKHKDNLKIVLIKNSKASFSVFVIVWSLLTKNLIIETIAC